MIASEVDASYRIPTMPFPLKKQPAELIVLAVLSEMSMDLTAFNRRRQARGQRVERGVLDIGIRERSGNLLQQGAPASLCIPKADRWRKCLDLVCEREEK